MARTPPHGRRSRRRFGAGAAITASLLAGAFVGPPPGAASDDHSDLHSREHHLKRSIDVSRTDVGEVSRHLLRTQGRLSDAREDLDTARGEFAALRERVRQAAAVDSRAQDIVEAAMSRLHDARADLRQGRRDIATKRGALAAYAVSNYQSVGNFSLGIAFESQSAQEALDNLQAADTVLNKQSTALQEFQATRVLLRLTTQRVSQTEEEVAERRRSAADKLQAQQGLAEAARSAKQAVANRVANLRDLRTEMVSAKRVEIRRLDTLQAERDRVEKRLRRIAERRARQHARALAKARESSAGADQLGLFDDGYLSYPVRNTYITSGYGMRMHPVLHVRKLHDGTDLHAQCGTPVYAAAAGRVLSEYFNGGYGNRLLLDSGFVQGVSLSTSYNHLSSYAVGVGQQVERGQLIAYSGDTGYSTACHLHFMVYVNGYTVDPQRWW